MRLRATREFVWIHGWTMKYTMSRVNAVLVRYLQSCLSRVLTSPRRCGRQLQGASRASLGCLSVSYFSSKVLLQCA